MDGSFMDEIDGQPLEEWLEDDGLQEHEVEETGMTVFDPYRGSSDLAELGDGLQTAVEDLQGHENRLVDLEIFAAGRHECSGDAVYGLAEAQDRLHLTRLRMFGLATLLTFAMFAFGVGTLLVRLTKEAAELQQRVRELESLVVDTHRDTGRSFKRLEVVTARGYDRCDQSIQLLGDRLDPGPVWRRDDQPHAVRRGRSEEPHHPKR